MMEFPIHEVVNVIAVRDRFMAAIGTVDMPVLVPVCVGKTTIRIDAGHFNFVFEDLIAELMMQMAVMQIIGVSGVLDRGVAAARSVFMLVVWMRFVIAHSAKFSL
jgi:hypothetical protein